MRRGRVLAWLATAVAIAKKIKGVQAVSADGLKAE